MSNGSAGSALSPTPPANPPARPSTHVSLSDFPPDATFHLWRKPATGIAPVDGGEFHIDEIFPSEGDSVLICFASTATDDWSAIKREIAVAKRIGITPLVVASVDSDQIACALFGAVDTVFVPSPTLRRILDIDRTSHGTRNALILIRNGQVTMTWTPAKDDGYDQDRKIKPFDWTSVLTVIG